MALLMALQVSGLAGCVYTQLTDVAAEWNGLLTYVLLTSTL